MNVFRHLLGPEATACIKTKLNRLISRAAFSEALGRCRGCPGRCANSQHNVSPPSLKARRLNNSRCELVAAWEASSTTGLILFRAFVEFLVVSIRAEMGAKGVENMVLIATDRQTDRRTDGQTQTTSTFIFGTQGQIYFFMSISRPTRF